METNEINLLRWNFFRPKIAMVSPVSSVTQKQNVQQIYSTSQ